MSRAFFEELSPCSKGCGKEGAIHAQALMVTLDREVLPTTLDGTATLDGVLNIGARSNRGALDWYGAFESRAR